MTTIDASYPNRWNVPVHIPRLIMLVTVVMTAIGAFPFGNAGAQQPRVYTAQLNGIFSELTADHTIRVLERAERQEADALLLTVNSPGGLDRAVRRLNQAILASEVPVIAFVGPDEDAEALAGAFLITLAANKTVMHPDAVIGTSPPPGLADLISPEEREARIDFASAIANRTALIRGRDNDQVEHVIQEQLILDSDEAYEAGIVDAIAETPAEALQILDGETVQTALGSVDLSTSGARLIEISMTWWEITLRAITSASVAYILLSAGLLLLIVELFAPGRLIAGVPAVICLALAFVALGNLPVSWFGLALMLLATILFIAELRTPWLGVAGAFGLVAYVAGSLTLYRPWGAMSAFAPDVSVNIWVIVGTMVGWVIVLLITMRAVFRARQGPIEAHPLDLIGQAGVVIKSLDPRGVVRINDQEWSAMSESGHIEPGTDITVEQISGATLYVSPVASDNHSPAGDPQREAREHP